MKVHVAVIESWSSISAYDDPIIIPENLNSANEEQCDKLETQLKEDKFTLAESERKYDDIARKLHGKEDEMERSGERWLTLQHCLISYPIIKEAQGSSWIYEDSLGF